MQDLQYYSEVDVQQLESLISLDDLLQVIGYQVDKIQRGADKWKCFCPIHKETIFRSLTIQVGRRTFRCGFLQCKGHRGGSLLDLYRLALDKDEIETIDFWSKRLKFPIKRKDEAEDETVEAAPDEIPTEEIGVEYDDEDFLQDLVETDVETVSTISSVTQQQESLSDDYDFDLDTVDFDLTPTTEEPAEIVEEEALEVEQEIEQEVVEEPVPVETVVEPVIAKPKTADQYLFDIGQMLAEDRRDEADSLLNDALEQFPQHPELLHARVRYYESGGLTAQAIEVLEELLEIYRQRHLPDGCLRAAHQILVLDPDSLSAFDTIIEAHLQRHESNLAVRFLQDAIRLCLEGNEPNQALQRVEKLREICIPGSPEESRALEQEIHILEMLGRIEDVVALRLELAKLYIRKELVGKAGDILEKIIESAPQCREAYQLLVDLYLARGMQQQAIAQMQRLAEQYLSPAPDGSEEAAAKGMEQAIATYMHILELEPGQTETRNRLALLYKHSGAMDKAAEQYFTIAQTYRDKELLGRAIRIYENLIQQKIEVPRATQTLVDVLLEKGDETSAVRRLTDLAQTFLQEENFAEAETSLKKAAALQPGQESLQRQLVELYRKTNQKGPRLETYRQLLKIVDQQGDEEKLKQLCEEIIEIDPQNPDAALRLKRMEETAQEAEPAEKEPGSIHAMLARAESLKSEGEHTQAIEILKSALLVETGNEQIWRNLADAYFQAGQMEQSAETLIRHTDWLDSEGRSDDALKLLSAASERLPRFPMPNRLALLRIRSQLQLKTNKQDKAFTTCTEIVDLSKNNPEDWLNLARLADEQQREEQALQSFQQAAELFANNRQWPASAQCLRRILELTPEDTEVRIRLSELLQKQGESAEAIRQRLQATTILAASQSIEKALAALEPVLDLHPPHLQALEQWFSLVQQSPDDLATQVDRAINLAEVYKTQGLVGKAGQHLETLRQLLPEEKKVLRAQIDLYRETGTPQKAVALLLEQGRLHREQGRFDAAGELLDEARQLAPDQVEVLRAQLDLQKDLDDKPAQSALLLSLAELAAGRGLIGKQIDYLRSAWYLSPEETSIGDTLADIHLARGDESAAIEALSHVIETHQKAGQEKAVRETYERILSIRPTEAKIRFQLAEHLLEQQDIQIACEHLQRIVKQFAGQLPPSDPDLIPVLESTYRHLIDQTEDIDYQRQLGDFYRATDDFPAAGCAYYEVLQQCPDDEPEIAIETCRQILDIAPGESSIEKQLAALYQKAGRQKDAGELYRGLWEKYWQSWSAAGEQQPVTEGALVDRVIETAEQLSQLQPEDDTLHYRMAEFYTTIEQTDQAITHWIALGEIYTEHGDKNQAAQTYRRILEIQPDLLEVRIRLAEVLESQGQLEEALEEHLRLGSAYQEQKQWEQARSAFQRAADMAPSNPAALSALLEIAQTQDDHEGTKTLLLQLAELGNEELDRLKTCLELDPSDQAVRERYLQSLIRSEEWVGATEQLQQLVSEYSEQNQYDLALGLLERSREHFTEQIEISELLQTTLENQLNSAQQENQPPLVVERISRQLNVERMACAENLQVADRSEDAENLLKKVIQADEDNDEARHRLLKLLQEGGELSDANRKLSAKLWQQLGDIYSKRGLLEDAQNAYSETLNLSPRARIARQRLATLNAERGAVEDSIAQQRQLAQQALDDSDWNRAAEALEEVLKIQPGDEQTLEQLAKTYLKLDDQFKAWEKAESLLLSVERRQDSEAVLKWADFILKLDPTRSDILQRQIGAYIQLGQQQEAAEGLWQLAELLQGQEETEAEQSACVRLLELDLERFDLHRKAALRLFDLGMQQRGRRELERLARRSIEQNRLADTLEIYSLLHEQYPKETEYLLALAEGYTKAGQGTQALQHRLSLHEHYLQLNRPVEMVSNLRAALELAPEQARIHGLLGEVFADLGNYREAIERLMAAAERSETEQDRLHAAQYYRTVLKVDSSHLEALRCFNRLQTGCALDDTEREELMKVRCRLVRLLTQEGKAAVPEIDKLAEALQADYENDETILKVLAGAYREIESEKAIDLSLHLLEQELRRKDWSEAEKTLAKIRQGGGLTPEHLQHLLTLCQETPLQSELVSERTKLAEAYIARQDREAAIEQYRILVESDIEPILHRQALIENLDIAGHHDHSRKEKLALADLLRQQGRPREAMAWVNSALNYEKDDLECLGLLSDLLLEINSLQEARPVIRKMAAVAEEHGDFLKAEEYLQKLIDLFPEDGDLQEEMARLQLERGQRERGLESLVQAAETFAEAGQIERAITLYEKAISQQDDGIDIRRKLIALLLQKGLRQEALAQERAIIDWHLQRDEIQQAVAGYEQLIESDPQDLSLPQEMADMLLRAGQTERAVEVLFRLAEICRLREMLKRAQDTFQQILSLQPVHEQARRRLAEIYIEKGMEEEGQSELLELAKQIEAGEIKKPAPEDDLDALGNWILELNPGNTSILLPLAQLIQPMRKRKPEWGAGLWSRIHISLGLQYLSRGEANEAQRCIKEIETATPSHPELVSLKERLEQLQRFQLPQETFRENLRKAQEHWELGEYGTAAQLYEQLLKSQPRDIELILRLAEAYQRQGQRPKAIDWLESRGRDFASERNFDSARQCFHQCLDLQPERLEIHTALADLALAEDRLDTAVEQYLHLADLVESPQALPQAIRALEKAHDIAPENEEVLQRLAAHYQKSKDIEKARETLRALAQLSRKKHQIEGAIAALQEALAIGEQQPSIAGVPQKELLRQNISLHQEIAEALIQQGKPALAAENLISAGQTALLAEVFETAQTCFEQVLQLPEHKLEPTIIQRTYEGLTEALTQSGKPEKAAETLAQLAQFHDSRKHIDKALDALQQAHQLAPEQRSHLEQLCQACLTADREEDYIRFSLKLAQLLLARDLIGRAEAVYRTLRAMKRWDKPDLAPDQGEPCYREILQPLLNLCLDKGATDDAIELQSDLANRYLNTGDIEEAEKHYQQILKLQSDHEPTLEQLVQVYQGQQRHAEAIETLRKLASVAETRGYPPQALDLLFQILDIEPDHAQALRDIERLAQVPGQTQTAIQELRNRFGQHFKSNNSRAVQAIGGLILRLDPAAEKIRIQLPEAFVWDKESKKAVDHFDQLGQRYRKQSQPELAKQCFIRALEIDPDREQIQNQIAEIDQQLNQEEKTERRKKVREQIEEVLQSNEPTRVFEILESNIQKDRDDTQLADWTADLYEKAIEGKAPFSRKADAGHRKQWLAGATTIRLKRTHEFQKDGDLTKARNQLSRILALDPENEEAGNLQLRILSELGQTDALLQLGRQMASAYRGKGQWQAAVDLYRRLEQYTPATPALLGEMATALVKMGQPGEAATVYRRQADLFLKDELYAQALSAYNEILSLLPDDQETLEGLLAVYVLRGDVRGALTYGRRILDQHLKRNDYPAAEAMLQRMIELDPNQPSLRREKIELLRREGKEDLLIREMEALSDFYTEGELLSKAIEVLREILEVAPDRRSIHERLIEGLLQTGQTAAAAEQYLQAAEYWQVRDESLAGQCLQEALQLQPDNPDIIKPYAEYLARVGRKAECRDQMDHLARILEDRKDWPAAARVREKMIRIVPEDGSILEPLVQLYEKMKQPEKAGPLMETLARNMEAEEKTDEAVEAYLQAAQYFYEAGVGTK